MQQCCEKAFGYGEACAYEDYCKEAAEHPSRRPTRRPRDRTTRIPTERVSDINRVTRFC